MKNEVFLEWIRGNEFLAIDHDRECFFHGKPTPINECGCFCYIRAIFEAGQKRPEE